ncbi:hypothetical protein IGI04_024811 [Brassica rapa subsp. trilocularis]|uniref:Uncharacterized protein n=1 Tax=Brassica rapa subsp. trilocularis TaxID=1813537 RepID=A0ABQ7M7S6_BRACM|nr:hypothetical protein IGI04_024811 [Brassica rapa subsp. trilocularis]
MVILKRQYVPFSQQKNVLLEIRRSISLKFVNLCFRVCAWLRNLTLLKLCKRSEKKVDGMCNSHILSPANLNDSKDPFISKSIQISVLFVNLSSAEHEKTVEICCAGLVKYSAGKVLFHAYNVLSSRSQREASATRDMKLKVYSAVLSVFMLSVEAECVAWKAGSKPEITQSGI